MFLVNCFTRSHSLFLITLFHSLIPLALVIIPFRSLLPSPFSLRFPAFFSYISLHIPVSTSNTISLSFIWHAFLFHPIHLWVIRFWELQNRGSIGAGVLRCCEERHWEKVIDFVFCLFSCGVLGLGLGLGLVLGLVLVLILVWFCFGVRVFGFLLFAFVAQILP